MIDSISQLSNTLALFEPITPVSRVKPSVPAQGNLFKNPVNENPFLNTSAVSKLGRTVEKFQFALNDISEGQSQLNIAHKSTADIRDKLLSFRDDLKSQFDEPLTKEQKQNILGDLKALSSGVNDIIGKAKFNGELLLSGDFSRTVQTGLKSDDTFKITISEQVDPVSIGFAEKQEGEFVFKNAKGELLTEDSSDEDFNDLLEITDRSIELVQEKNNSIAKLNNNLVLRRFNTGSTVDLTQSAFDRITDNDVAQEQLAAIKTSILSNPFEALLAQAKNTAPVSVLNLFK